MILRWVAESRWVDITTVESINFNLCVVFSVVYNPFFPLFMDELTASDWKEQINSKP